MAGLNDTDIRLDGKWQLTAAKNGDAPMCRDLECFRQDVQLEAITQPGELFYDEEWGWGLQEFINSVDDPMTRLEITTRIRTKLALRPQVDSSSIVINLTFKEDEILIGITFDVIDLGTTAIQLSLNRVNVEVVAVD